MTAAIDSTDPQRPVDRWFGSYSEDHRHPANVLIHYACVPAILWTVIALLWIVPVPAVLGRPGFWAAAAMFFALIFYLRLSRSLAIGMLTLFVLLSSITEMLYRTLGPAMLGWTALTVFVAAWIGQFVGHKIEGKKPSFFTDLVYLLIGPAWIVAKVMRHATFLV